MQNHRDYLGVTSRSRRLDEDAQPHRIIDRARLGLVISDQKILRASESAKIKLFVDSTGVTCNTGGKRKERAFRPLRLGVGLVHPIII